MQGTNKTNVVIVGGGFAGVAVAKKLVRYARSHPELAITLLSRSKVSLFTPLLHEVATGSLRPEGVGESLEAMFAGTNVKLVFDTVQSVAIGARTVTTNENGAIAYDYLVLATGTKPNFFNTPGAEQFSYTLKTLEDAIELKKAIVVAAQEPHTAYTIIGGGPTGVEIAAELGHFVRDVQGPDTTPRQTDECPRRTHVTLVQRGPELIPMFPPKFRVLAKERLEKLGVTTMLGVGVRELEGTTVSLDGDIHLHSDVTIWTAGVGVDIPAVEGWAPPAPLSAGRLPVEQTLQLVGAPNVFVLGDIAAFMNPGDKGPVPQLAQVATRQGPVAARNIIALVEGRELEHYSFVSVGLLLSVGEWMAIAQIKSLFLSGKFAWLLWRAIYLSKLEMFIDQCRVFSDWVKDLFLPRRA